MKTKCLLYKSLICLLIVGCTTNTPAPTIPTPLYGQLLTNTPTVTPPATSTPISTSTATPTPYKLIYNGNINCHSGPGTSFPVVMTVRGQVISVLAKDSILQNWLFVQIEGGQLCWLNNNIINVPLPIISMLSSTDFLTPRITFTPPTPFGTATPDPRGNNPPDQPLPPTPNYALTTQAQTQVSIAQTHAAQTQVQASINQTQLSIALTKNSQALTAVCTSLKSLKLDGSVSSNGKDIKLSWSDVSNVIGYQVYRSINGSGYSVIEGPTTKTSLTDNKQPHDTYTYYVVAENSCGSASSNEVSISR